MKGLEYQVKTQGLHSKVVYKQYYMDSEETELSQENFSGFWKSGKLMKI